jgi:hypothetical protein
VPSAELSLLPSCFLAPALCMDITEAARSMSPSRSLSSSSPSTLTTIRCCCSSDSSSPKLPSGMRRPVKLAIKAALGHVMKERDMAFRDLKDLSDLSRSTSPSCRHIGESL